MEWGVHNDYGKNCADLHVDSSCPVPDVPVLTRHFRVKGFLDLVEHVELGVKHEELDEKRDGIWL